MSKLLIMGIAAVSAISMAAGESRAQTYYGSGCCACGCPSVGATVGTPVQMAAPAQTAAGQAAGVQTYQRFSYAPAPAARSQGYAQPTVVGSAPMSYAPTYAVPSYRSYDAQPSYYGGGYSRNAGNLWQYPKGDMRRQMH